MLIASHELVQKRVAIAIAVLQDCHEYNFRYSTLLSGVVRTFLERLCKFFFGDYAGTLRLKKRCCIVNCSAAFQRSKFKLKSFKLGSL